MQADIVSPLSCVSCVPASCVHIWFVSCPCLVWLLVKSVPVVFVSLACVFKFLPVQFSVVWSTCYSPVFLSVSALPCPGQPFFFVYIKYYYLSLLHVCVFLYPPRVCTVTDIRCAPKCSTCAPKHFQSGATVLQVKTVSLEPCFI